MTFGIRHPRRRAGVWKKENHLGTKTQSFLQSSCLRVFVIQALLSFRTNVRNLYEIPRRARDDQGAGMTRKYQIKAWPGILKRPETPQWCINPGSRPGAFCA